MYYIVLCISICTRQSRNAITYNYIFIHNVYTDTPIFLRKLFKSEEEISKQTKDVKTLIYI